MMEICSKYPLHPPVWIEHKHSGSTCYTARRPRPAMFQAQPFASCTRLRSFACTFCWPLLRTASAPYKALSSYMDPSLACTLGRMLVHTELSGRQVHLQLVTSRQRVRGRWRCGWLAGGVYNGGAVISRLFEKCLGRREYSGGECRLQSCAARQE
jgi:hypothetical protein